MAIPIVSVVKSKRCTACAGCAAFCPTTAITVTDAAKIGGDCIACEVCGEVCPVLHPYPTENEFDNIKEMFIARSGLVGQDGATVSGIAKNLLEIGAIDAVIGVERDADWRASPVVITTPAEVIKMSGTKYSSVPVLSVLRETSRKYKKIMVVGVPCQAHAANLLRRKLGRYEKRIALIVGIFCMESFTYDTICNEIIAKKLGLSCREITKMNITKGKFWAYAAPDVVKSVSLKEVKPLARTPCHSCLDFTAYYADISCGSVGSPEGWNTVFIRTDRGKQMFDLIRDKFEIKPEVKLDVVKKLTTLKHTENAPKPAAAAPATVAAKTETAKSG
ncbi:MAG: Coenzyme F420 hydrogenase/dehydrogenase, beta subunit C-terminal domain [Halobacteria archaeon]